jgi:type 1 fimbria pilin
MKYIKIIFSMTVFISAWCHATCTVNHSYDRYFTFGNITVQRDTPVGTVLATAVTSGTGTTSMSSCTGTDREYWGLTYLGGVLDGISDVYKTNIPGVGIKGTALRSGSTSITFSNPAWPYNISAGTGGTITDNSTATFYLIKTGPINNPGTLTGGEVARTYFQNYSEVRYNLLGTSSIVAGATACTLNSQNLIFPIGNVLASVFGSSVGATPAVAQNTQNLGLVCDPQANINVTLSGTQNPDVGTTSVLALTGQGSAGVAKGVGVQIVYNGTPLSLNSRIVIKRSAGGPESIPLVARYYQTKTAVATGTANASATLNLTYQ